mmetsp:Transcript_121650/g.259680  ORF Transcript_121650/g.259680 Transcript_121650/m.259680 type:complete len:115 (+) Transcript_121650:1153-1497(+)
MGPHSVLTFRRLPVPTLALKYACHQSLAHLSLRENMTQLAATEALGSSPTGRWAQEQERANVPVSCKLAVQLERRYLSRRATCSCRLPCSGRQTCITARGRSQSLHLALSLQML